MSYLKLMAAVVVTGGLLTACGGGGGSMSSSPAPSGNTPTTPATPAPAPTDPATADFTTTVKEQIAATSETSVPMETNDMKFTFKDDDNPTAFDDVLPPQTN